MRQSTWQLRANLALTPDLQTQTLGSVSSDTPDTSGTGLLVSPKPAPSAGFPVESAPAPSSARNLAACSGLLADPTSDVSEQSGGPCLTHTAHLQPGRPHHPQDLCPLSLSWIAAVASSGVPASPVCPRAPLPSVGTAARQFSARSRQNLCSPVTRSNLSPHSRLGSARSPCHSRALFPPSSPSSLSAFTPLQPHRPPVVPERPGQAPHRPPPRLRRARPGSRWARPLAALQCVCPQIPRYSRPPLAAPRPSGLMLPSQHATLPSTLRFTCAARLALVQFRLPRVVCVCVFTHAHTPRV